MLNLVKENKVGMDLEYVIEKVLERECFKNRNTGRYEEEIYADYRDIMDDDVAIKILEKGKDYFCDEVYDWYSESEMDINSLLRYKVEQECGELDIEFNDDFVMEYIWEHVDIIYPFDKFLQQEFKVNIRVNNFYDMHYNTDNSLFENSNDNQNVLEYLIQQQGYTRSEVKKALMKGKSENTFINSVVREIENASQLYANELVFLTSMTFEELLEYRQKLVENEIKSTDKISIDKTTMCGFYNSWNGSGSCLEIQLDKDFQIELKNVEISIDGSYRYDVNGTYGLIDECWQQGGVKLV